MITLIGAPPPAAAHFCHYDLADGRIVQTGYCAPDDLRHQIIDGCGRINVAAPADAAKQYVLTGRVVDRPVLAGFDRDVIIADGVDAAVMIVPPGCAVRVDGVAHPPPEDGELRVTATRPGAWRIEIDCWPWMPFRGGVTCISP